MAQFFPIFVKPNVFILAGVLISLLNVLVLVHDAFARDKHKQEHQQADDNMSKIRTG